MKTLRLWKSLAAALAITSWSAHALVSADVLPKGVRAAAFVWGSSQPITSSFNDRGRLDSLVKPLNRSVGIEDFAAAEPRLSALRQVLNDLSAEQLGDQLVVSNLYSRARVQEQRMVTGLLWGVSERLSLGVIVPVVKRQTEVSFSTKTVNNASAIKRLVGEVPALAEGLQSLADAGIDTETFQREVFLKNGYRTPHAVEVSALGDLELEARYRYLQSRRLDLALRGGLKLPTAQHEADLRNLVDREVGEGAVSVKAGAIQSYRLLPQVLSFHLGVFGTHRLSAKKKVALPRDPSEPLADLNDASQIEQVDRKLGDSLNTDAGVMLDFWKGALSLSASHVYTARAEDRVSGSKGLDYGRLEANTAGYEQGVELGVELSSIPLYLDNVAPAPAKLSFTWYQPMSGKNMIYAPFGRVDAVLLF
jgi:hypothetical protein